MLENKTKTGLKNKIAYCRRKTVLLRTVKGRAIKIANCTGKETLRALSAMKRINIINAMSGNTGTQCPETQTKCSNRKGSSRKSRYEPKMISYSLCCIYMTSYIYLHDFI